MQRSNFIFLLGLIIVIASLFGCANPRQVMVNPKTWQQVVCASSGWGWLGAPMAYSNFNTCVNNQKVRGMVPLEIAEANDKAKFDVVVESNGKTAFQPNWQAGYFWEYSLSNGKESSLTVTKVGNFHDIPGYYVTRANGTEVFYVPTLGIKAVLDSGNIDTEYDPALMPFDFPITQGKAWYYAGEMRRTTGSLNLSTHYEVKGYGKIRVPAGEFEAYYILGRSDYGARVNELWYSPEVKNYVKGVLYTNGGKIIEELIKFKCNTIKNAD